MKKWFVWIVTAAICLSLFAGCTTQAPAVTQTAATPSTATTAPASAAPTLASTAAPSPSPEPAFNLTAQIEEQILYDEGGIVVKALSLKTAEVENEHGKFTLLGLICSIENHSDTTITPKLFTIAINGLVTSDYAATTMSDEAAYEGATKSWFEPGEEATCAFTLASIKDPTNFDIPLVDMGVTDVANVSFDLALTDPDSDEWNNFIAIKPVSINTSIAQGYTQSKPDDQSQVIYDENGIRILCLGLSDLDGNASPEYNEQFWSSVDLYIENNTTENIAVEMAEEENIVYVNGVACQWLFGAGWLSPVGDLRPGTGAFTRIKLYKMHYDDHFDVSAGTLHELKCSFIVRPMDYIPYSGTEDTILVQTPELTMTFE